MTFTAWNFCAQLSAHRSFTEKLCCLFMTLAAYLHLLLKLMCVYGCVYVISLMQITQTYFGSLISVLYYRNPFSLPDLTIHWPWFCICQESWSATYRVKPHKRVLFEKLFFTWMNSDVEVSISLCTSLEINRSRTHSDVSMLICLF